MGVRTSKTVGTWTLYHSFFWKGWALNKHRRLVPGDSTSPSTFLAFSKEMAGGVGGGEYLHLLLLSLLFEVSGILSCSHVLDGGSCSLGLGQTLKEVF